MKIKNLITVMILLLPLGFTFSQNQIDYGVIGAGGGKVSGTTNIITFTLGEPVIGKVAGSTNITAIGFWNVYQQDVLTSVEDEDVLPTQYKLEQNYPNPFNPSTIIKYAVPERSMVSIKVYNIAGEEVITVVNEEKDIGWYEVKLYSTGLSSGIYLCRMQAGNYISIKKMMLLK